MGMELPVDLVLVIIAEDVCDLNLMQICQVSHL